MILGLDLYDTITSWPMQLRRLAESVMAGGGEVHIVTAIKPVNEDRARALIKASRVPHTRFHIVFYERHEDLPQLKVPVYKGLRCDVIVEDNRGVVELARLQGLCALEVAGLSDNPLAVGK